MEVKKTLDDFGQVEEADEDETPAVLLQLPSASTAKETRVVGPTVKAEDYIVAAPAPPTVSTPDWSLPSWSLESPVSISKKKMRRK